MEVWSCELAYLAGENVKQCKMKHDKCRKIDGNPYIGQNIYYKAKTSGHYTYAEAIRLANDAWFNEIAYTTQEDMDKLSIAKYIIKRLNRTSIKLRNIKIYY